MPPRTEVVTTSNTIKILEISGIDDVKVYKGNGKPLMRQPKIEGAVLIHGENGLGKYVKLPDTERKHEDGNCIMQMYNAIKNAP